MLRLGQGGGQGRDLRARLLQVGARLLDVERRGQPRLGAPVGELVGLGLAGEVLLRDGQHRLVRAGVHVVERHFRGKGDLRGVQVGLGRFQVGLRRLDPAAGAAEDVRLPCGVEARAVERARVAGAVIRVALPAAAGGARGRDGREEPRGRHPPAGPRFPEPCLRGPDVGAPREGLLDEPGQGVIPEPLPPPGKLAGWRPGHRLAVRPPAAPGGRHRQLRLLVVRPDRCATRHEDQDRRQGAKHLPTRNCILGRRPSPADFAHEPPPGRFRPHGQ